MKQKYSANTFFLTVFCITWPTWFYAGYLSQIDCFDVRFYVAMFLGLLAPSITCFWLKRGLIEPDKNIGAEKKDTVTKISARYSVFPFLIIPISMILSIYISIFFGFSLSQFTISKNFSFSIGVVPVVIILLLAALFEELGWRGYGIESLERKKSVFLANFWFSLLWGIWHLPLFFIKNSYQNLLWQENIWYGVNFFISIIPITFIISCFYYKTNRSVLFAVLFHLGINISAEFFLVEPFTKCIQTFVLFFIAGLLVYKERRLFFSSNRRCLDG